MVQSIDEQLDTITQDVADTYTALGAKGATLPAKKGTSNLKATVDSLPKGGFPNKLYDVDASGNTYKPSGTFSEGDFDDIVTMSSIATFENAYSRSSLSGNCKFKNLSSTYGNAFANAFSNSTPGSTGKCNIEFTALTTLRNNKNFYHAFDQCTAFNTISFPKLKNIGNEDFTYAFNNCNVSNVLFPELKSIGYVTGDSKPCEYMFYGCTGLKEIFFPKLTDFSGEAPCEFMFYSSSLEYVHFDALTTINNNGPLKSAFWESKHLKEVFFPVLEIVYTTAYAFYNSSLQKISFPALKGVTKSAFSNAFSGCKDLKEIHFPARMKSTIESITDYASKWGATNATIYFDL